MMRGPNAVQWPTWHIWHGAHVASTHTCTFNVARVRCVQSSSPNPHVRSTQCASTCAFAGLRRRCWVARSTLSDTTRTRQYTPGASQLPHTHPDLGSCAHIASTVACTHERPGTPASSRGSAREALRDPAVAWHASCTRPRCVVRAPPHHSPTRPTMAQKVNARAARRIRARSLRRTRREWAHGVPLWPSQLHQPSPKRALRMQPRATGSSVLHSPS